MRGDLSEVFKLIKGIDDLPYFALFMYIANTKNRLRVHQPVL